ncbi:MAG: pyruvate kinase alpha/beta domain-containing protein, partial [Nitrospirota bacterium]
RPLHEPDALTQTEAIAVSACRTANELGIKKIICFTRSGATALHVSKYRPSAATIAATHDDKVYRRMRLFYGVVPLMVKDMDDTDRMIREVERAALSKGLVKKGDLVVVTLGVPAGKGTNLLKIHRVGESFGTAR